VDKGSLARDTGEGERGSHEAELAALVSGGRAARADDVPAPHAREEVAPPVAGKVRLVAHRLDARAVGLEVEEEQLLARLAHAVHAPGERDRAVGLGALARRQVVVLREKVGEGHRARECWRERLESHPFHLGEALEACCPVILVVGFGDANIVVNVAVLPLCYTVNSAPDRGSVLRTPRTYCIADSCLPSVRYEGGGALKSESGVPPLQRRVAGSRPRLRPGSWQKGKRFPARRCRGGSAVLHCAETHVQDAL